MSSTKMVNDLIKFNSSPGTMEYDELINCKIFFEHFTRYYLQYAEANYKREFEGVCMNELQKNIDKVCWYLNYKGE